MKVIKRDGRAVDYDRQKIVIAIEKANNEVRANERVSKEEIDEIINYIEDLDKKRILVEDIQDIIEEKLMEHQKYKLAKKYIVYRYTRALVRKQNTTDESILGLIKNQNNELSKEYQNKNAVLASTQRNCIAGEVSKDLTKRILLPEKISKAHEEGVLHFHNADYFLQPVFNNCLINIKDMLENGTVINGKLIESPKSFRVACIVTTQIIAAIASNQYGGQSVDLKHLGKYLRKSRKKFQIELQKEYEGKLSQDIINNMVEKMLQSELSSGVQTIQYQINTLMTANGESPIVTLFLNLDENDEYIEENAMIIEEILKQRYQGIKNEEGIYQILRSPKLVYVLYQHNCLKGGKYDYLTRLAIKCSLKGSYPNYISSKKMCDNYEGNVFSPMGDESFLSPYKDEEGIYKFEGRFNQGVVSINLPQIAIISDGDEKTFYSLLDERLELCYEALMCRHYALLGTKSDTSPIHWKYGGIARMDSDETIDKYLKGGYSTISLGYIGLYEAARLMKKENNNKKEYEEFLLKVIKHLREKVETWKKETGLGFILYAVQEKDICDRFEKIDKERFGNIKDKECYSNTYCIDAKEKEDAFEKLKFENMLQEISSGGLVACVNISNIEDNLEELEEIVKFIYDNIQYVEFNKD